MKKQKAPLEIPSREAVEQEKKRLNYQAVFRSMVKKVVFSLLAVAAVSAISATLFFPVLDVAGNSMEPTVHDGNIVMLCKSAEYKAGDLCGFYWQNKLLIKRIIGVPGDTISLDADGNVYVNGSLLDEPYIKEFVLGECDVSFPCQVPSDSYFVLGDHRSTSIDSRSSAIGCVSKDQIIGKIFLRLWPLEEFKIF